MAEVDYSTICDGIQPIGVLRENDPDVDAVISNLMGDGPPSIVKSSLLGGAFRQAYRGVPKRDRSPVTISRVGPVVAYTVVVFGDEQKRPTDYQFLCSS